MTHWVPKNCCWIGANSFLELVSSNTDYSCHEEQKLLGSHNKVLLPQTIFRVPLSPSQGAFSIWPEILLVRYQGYHSWNLLCILTYVYPFLCDTFNTGCPSSHLWPEGTCWSFRTQLNVTSSLKSSPNDCLLFMFFQSTLLIVRSGDFKKSC